jgi:hypothetical protein
VEQEKLPDRQRLRITPRAAAVFEWLKGPPAKPRAMPGISDAAVLLHSYMRDSPKISRKFRDQEDIERLERVLAEVPAIKPTTAQS